jgi:DNA-binding response OmpR family regulator
MSKRTRILVVDSDMHTLSKIYLSLINKNYKVEASDDAQEIMARTERFKPRLIILNTATKNLTPEVYRDLAQKRIHMLLVTSNAEDIPYESKRWEIVQIPADITFFDSKIREMLNIIE